MNEPRIVVHGGAGSVSDETREKRKPVLRKAANRGYRILRREDSPVSRAYNPCLSELSSAVEAVEGAVRVLEDSPHFNAGTGSVLTLDGRVEMDAAIMDEQGVCGAVTCLENVQNPISLSLLVSEKTDHVFLTGIGLRELVRTYDIPSHDPVTSERREKREELIQELENMGYDTDTIPDPKIWGKYQSVVRKARDRINKEEGETSTVGAVAMDRNGILASATSTGGTSYKLPGRIGDTPLIGAGTIANGRGAVSATGDGEGIIQTVLGQRALFYTDRSGKDTAEGATDQALEYASSCDVSCGLIMIDRRGGIGTSYNTDSMDTYIRTPEIEELRT